MVEPFFCSYHYVVQWINREVQFGMRILLTLNNDTNYENNCHRTVYDRQSLNPEERDCYPSSFCCCCSDLKHQYVPFLSSKGGGGIIIIITEWKESDAILITQSTKFFTFYPSIFLLCNSKISE